MTLPVRSFANPLEPSFMKARPVWAPRLEREMNLTLGFHAFFELQDDENAILRITGCSVYRIFLNGKFLGYGPARGPHGYNRLDEWSLKDRCKPGANALAIEVAGYNANSYYHIKQLSFIQAEIVSASRVLAATDAENTDFTAHVIAQRIQKVQRYSLQRTFTEAYRLTPDYDKWRVEGIADPVLLVEFPQSHLLPRIAPYPAFDVLTPTHEIGNGTFRHNPTREVPPSHIVTETGKLFAGFPKDELEVMPHVEVQQFEFTALSHEKTPWTPGSEIRKNTFRTFQFVRNDAGFVKAMVSCNEPLKLYMVFDEVLTGASVSPTRYNCANVISFDLTEAGTYNLESFEPYQFKYIKIMAVGGDCMLEDLGLREYVNPATQKAVFYCPDPALNRIFEAARETFKQNAVDLFTDCAGRERAGWLCDSFFTSRVALDLCGNTDMERLFFQNYLLPEFFEGLPEGMLPMCYPADHNHGIFIPNWAMWFVIQLEEYLHRSGDQEMIDALRSRVLALLEFFKGYENSDGLLEKLPSWVFLEWSEANKLTQDVNYPSNMTYAEVLACAGRLYNLPELVARAGSIRETIRRQSYDGEYFVDNALRQPDGTLKLSGERTETCQYYAFFFRTATPQLYPELWARLRDDFGPQRKETGRYPEIHFSNAFIGNYLRLELLSREGLASQMLSETKGYFSGMEQATGTLWENDTPTASCSHGFASHVAHMYYRDILGIAKIDYLKRHISLRFTDVPLATCSGTIPIAGHSLTVSWTKGEKSFSYSCHTSGCFTVTADTSLLEECGYIINGKKQ